MKMLGLNPMEQEIVDLTNTITKNGLIYFPDFCKIILHGWREEDENLFRQTMFKVLKQNIFMNDFDNDNIIKNKSLVVHLNNRVSLDDLWN